jgi:protein O-GlcNAc transferase
MDYQKFLQELPNFYDHWGEDSVIPRSTQFQEVATTIAEIPRSNVMQLLNFAVSCLAREEIYCEVGTGQGLTLIGALLNHPDQAAYGVDDLSSEDPNGESLALLMENLEKFQLQDQVYFCDQNCEDFFFDLREAGTNDRIGVFFYDGDHDYRSQLMSLLLAREFLADQALVIINHTNWATPKQAIADFLSLNSEAAVLLDLSTPNNSVRGTGFRNSFGRGLIILSWDIQNKGLSIDNYRQQYQQKSVISAIYNLQILEQQQEEGQEIYFKALQLHAQGNLILAEKYYQDFLLWNNSSFEGWYNLGLLYHTGERYQAAIGSFQRAKASNPQFIDTYSSLGNSLVALGEIPQAIDVYHQGIIIDPQHFGCYLNLGNLLLSQGYLEQAIATYSQGLKFAPDNLDLSNNLSIAQAQYDNLDFLLTTGNSFYTQGKYLEATHLYQRLLDLDQTNITNKITHPVQADVYFNLSDAHQKLQNFDKSIEVLEAGTRQYPQDARLQFTLIIYLQQQARIEEAISLKEGYANAQAETAAKLLPEDYTFQLLQYLLVPMIYDTVEEIAHYKQRFSQGLITLQQSTNLDTPETIHQAFLGINRVTNFYLAYQAHNVKDLQIQYGRLLEKIMAARYPDWVQPLAMPELAKSGAKQKIKVGYVSAYLRSYSGTYWLQGWLKFHNPDHLEIYCYHTGNICDTVTENFRNYSHYFHHLPNDFEATCQQILADQLHILIFPEIGMDAPTMAMAGLRLAPVQCTAWGHPVTTGLSTIDYFISSELMEGDNAQDHYSETLVQLPNIGVAYPALGDIPEQIKDKSYFSFPEESVIYLCLQAPFKYLPQYDRVLPAIAQQVPQAKFIFLRGELLRQRLDRAFAAHGLVYTDFCLFLKIPAREDYLMLNLVADVFLDTCTWSGGNTSLEAIACGLPLVTYPGEFMRGRHADSFLKMIGVTETIAENVENYIEIAVRLGSDTAWRQEIKAKMQQRKSLLFDDRTCVTALEQFFDRVVQS